MEKWTYILLIISLIFFFIVYKCYHHNPFHPPKFSVKIDITGKRKPDYSDLIDRYFVDNGFEEIERQNDEILDWEAENSEELEEKWLFHKKRESQFEEACEEGFTYNFLIIKNQTRYAQHNYVRSSYQVEQIIDTCKFDYEELKNRYEELEKINFECTLREYNSKEQRKLMTPKLRKEIMLRDNYTCQICGKYMPDEVGLHIDHIIPVNKGGKSVKSNLQVLCSKCNGSKSNKINASIRR